MREVDLSRMNSLTLFHETFGLLPKSQGLVNQMNLYLGWRIEGEGSQAFASSLVGLAGNLAALKWCVTDTDRSVYRLCAARCYEMIRGTRQYAAHSGLIILPGWIRKSTDYIKNYSHGPNSTRLP